MAARERGAAGVLSRLRGAAMMGICGGSAGLIFVDEIGSIFFRSDEGLRGARMACRGPVPLGVRVCAVCVDQAARAAGLIAFEISDDGI
jgi:hypothetical protein